jgi:hypothetical protein
LDLSSTSALAASLGILDLSTPSTSSRGANGDSFIANFRQVTIEGTKARGRYLATRHQLNQVRQSPVDEGRFEADIEATKAEVSTLLDELEVEFQSMNEVSLESTEISRQVDELVDNDARMAALLDKMNRKLDSFQLTLGNF